MSHICTTIASGLGAGKPACGKGPKYLQEHLHIEGLHWILPPPFEESRYVTTTLSLEEKSQRLEMLYPILAEHSYYLAKTYPFFFSFGGDHSSAIPMWSGVSEGYKDRGDIGLIWVDAHMDAHTSKTSPSGNIHGMPLASLMGFGDTRLSHLLSKRQKIKPENIVLIGIRSYEEEEYALLQRLNVKIHFIEEVREKGFSSLLKKAIKDLSTRTVGYGISFDVDAMDPSIVGATGTPVTGGLLPSDLETFASLLFSYPPLAFELVEYNPDLDGDGSTFKFIQQLMYSLTQEKVVLI